MHQSLTNAVRNFCVIHDARVRANRPPAQLTRCTMPILPLIAGNVHRTPFDNLRNANKRKIINTNNILVISSNPYGADGVVSLLYRVCRFLVILAQGGRYFVHAIHIFTDTSHFCSQFYPSFWKYPVLGRARNFLQLAYKICCTLYVRTKTWRTTPFKIKLTLGVNNR